MRYLVIFAASGMLLAQVPTVQVSPTAAPKPAEQVPKPEEKCKVSGQVVSITSGEALRKVNLKLQPVGAGSEASATSDADGKFEFTGVMPGRYRLNSEKQGFMQQAYGAKTGSMGSATPLTLGKGQELKDLVFKLTPQGIIAGRVLDDEGEPVNMAIVQPLRYTYDHGRRQLQPFFSNASIFTNDQGEYRLSGLPPGKYYLSAGRMMTPGMPGIEAPPVPQPGKPEETLVTTYYPNVLEAASASTVDVGPGAEVRAIDIRMRKAKTVRIKGKVVDAAGQPASGAMLTMARRDAGMMMPFTGASAMVTNGDFQLHGVAPGPYYATVIVTNGGAGSPMMTRHRLDVGEDNVEGVTISLSKGWELSGSVKVEGANAAPVQSIKAILLPNEGFPINASQGQLKSDGSLQFKGVSPDIYRLELSGLPPNTYVKSVRYGTQDATDATIDLTTAVAGPIDIVLGSDSGSATGTVHNAKGEPVSGAAVTLVPKNAPAVRGDLFKTVYTDQNGSFQMRGIPPGEYKLMAWEEVETGAAEDAQFRAAFERYAAEAKVGASASLTQSLEMITKDAVEAEKAKGK